MKQQILLNTAADGTCRSLRACYGKCGAISFFLPTGHGITGVAIVEQQEDPL